MNRMQTRIAHAKLCLKQAQDRQASQSNVHHRSVSFPVGDMVLLYSKNLKLKKQEKSARKLMPKWIGPFTVSKLVGTVAVKLDLPHPWTIHPVFHVSLIKPYHANRPTA